MQTNFYLIRFFAGNETGSEVLARQVGAVHVPDCAKSPDQGSGSSGEWGAGGPDESPDTHRGPIHNILARPMGRGPFLHPHSHALETFGDHRKPHHAYTIHMRSIDTLTDPRR